jgi:DNA-binding NarL/FixJ family response regulator
MPNKQIADELRISIKTVEKHRQQLIDKLDIHDTAGLTRYAVDRGYVTAKRAPMPSSNQKTQQLRLRM